MGSCSGAQPQQGLERWRWGTTPDLLPVFEAESLSFRKGAPSPPLGDQKASVVDPVPPCATLGVPRKRGGRRGPRASSPAQSPPYAPTVTPVETMPSRALRLGPPCRERGWRLPRPSHSFCFVAVGMSPARGPPPRRRRVATNYSQHLPGSTNVIADSLSRNFHLSDNQLVLMLTSLVPPLRIKIVPLPQRLTSKIASLAQK